MNRPLRKSLYALLFVLFWTVSGAVGTAAGAQQDAASAVNQACSGVVRMYVETDTGLAGVGTGFGVGEAGKPTDIFITNWHVVTCNGESVDPYGDQVYIALSSEAIVNGRANWDYLIPCEVLYTTSGYPDLAVIQAERVIQERVALPLCPSEQVQRASTVYALGYPSSSDTANGSESLPADIQDITVTVGTLSRFTILESAENTKIIQHDAHINGGNSGGPLITADGAVIGINTYGFGGVYGTGTGSGDAAAREWSASIYIDYAMEALDQLGLAYDLYDPSAGSGGGGALPLWLAGGAVVLIGAGALAAVRRKKAAPALPSPAPSPVPAPAPSPAPAPVPAPNTAWDSGLRLQGVAGAYQGRRFSIGQRVRIGRDPSRSDLVYPASTPGVSGAHCELYFQNGQLYLRDLGSKNGTYLRRAQLRRLGPGEEAPVAEGDHICLGSPREEFVILRSSKIKN